jgi:multidrug efflux system membrane fusion protein
MSVFDSLMPVMRKSHSLREIPQYLKSSLAIVIACYLGACNSKEVPQPVPPPEVSVSFPITREITDALEYTGTTAAPASVEIRPRVTGFLEKVHFEPRARLKEGEVLFTIDARPFKSAMDRASADQAAKQAQLVKAEFDAEKIERLFKDGNASPDEMTKETANRDALRAALAASKAMVEQATLELGWCQVTSPIAGRAGRNLIDVGNIVQADQTVMAKIVNDDSIYAYFNAGEQDILKLRERVRQEGTNPSSDKLSLPIHMGLMTEQGFPHEGVIDYASPELDKTTGTMQVRGVFANADGVLLPGLFVRVRVPIGKPYQGMQVTERALGSDQGQRYLLVVNDKNVVEYRPVTVGTLQNGLRVITAGVSAKDQVIVNGLQRVRPGLTVKPVQTAMPVGPVIAAPASATSAAGTTTAPSTP